MTYDQEENFYLMTYDLIIHADSPIDIEGLKSIVFQIVEDSNEDLLLRVKEAIRFGIHWHQVVTPEDMTTALVGVNKVYEQIDRFLPSKNRVKKLIVKHE